MREKVFYPMLKTRICRPTEFVKTIQIPDSITVSELAQNLSVKGAEVVKQLMSMGVMATLNQPLDQDTAILVTEELGHKGEPAVKVEVEDPINGTCNL